ncbi:MAG: hypothetical protein WAW85_07730 [Gordonia sp. (in: high G+C Gram-positive bacteria)]|uniref:thermonuclease family protein n=1 Tax=Gordonia sp. (in: high G+C Gram-positive bacteria) TaxID=84139 RepID=UPI003BB66BAC
MKEAGRCAASTVVAVLAAAVLSCGSVTGTATAVPSERPVEAAGPVTVTYVVDGDTIKVRDAGGRDNTVRLVGIDTP